MEVVHVQAVEAVVEVVLDLRPGAVAERGVEVRVDLAEDLFAVIHGCADALALRRRPMRPAPAPLGLSDPAGRRTHTTLSASPFFPGAIGTSPCRLGCRGSRRSPCRRTL